MITELREFHDGVAFFRKRGWPDDLHNSLYAKLRPVSNGTFDRVWWDRVLPVLGRWRATRGTDHATLTVSYQQHAGRLRETWAACVHPHLSGDIGTADWQTLQPFYDACAALKPTASNSAVFPSKLAHFCAPTLFPVSDRLAVGGHHMSYPDYWHLIRSTWLATSPPARAQLETALTRIITGTGATVFHRYPTACKTTELRLIGRHHPSAPTSG